MSRFEAIGQIQQIGKLQEIGNNGFQKLEVIIKTVDQYTNFYLIEFTGNHIQLVNSLEEGANFNITCNLQGREYTNPDTGAYNVFMSLRAWKVERI